MFADEPIFTPIPSKPCVGCGWCCLDNPCAVSHRRHGYTRRCPDLHWDQDQGRYVCLVMLDHALEPEHREGLHRGEGCCAPLNPWRDDVRNRDKD